MRKIVTLLVYILPTNVATNQGMGWYEKGSIGVGVARSVGLEPTTSASAGLRSIQLSYERARWDRRCDHGQGLHWCRRWDLNPHALSDTAP